MLRCHLSSLTGMRDKFVLCLSGGKIVFVMEKAAQTQPYDALAYIRVELLGMLVWINFFLTVNPILPLTDYVRNGSKLVKHFHVQFLVPRLTAFPYQNRGLLKKLIGTTSLLPMNVAPIAFITFNIAVENIQKANHRPSMESKHMKDIPIM